MRATVRKNDYKIGKPISNVMVTKQGKTGIEIYVSTFGRIIFLLENKTQRNPFWKLLFDFSSNRNNFISNCSKTKKIINYK